jgi:hypothetical protein
MCTGRRDNAGWAKVRNYQLFLRLNTAAGADFFLSHGYGRFLAST